MGALRKILGYLACYVAGAAFFGILTFLPERMAPLHLTGVRWWLCYLGLETVLFGVLFGALIWWFLWRPTRGTKLPSRFFVLLGMALTPVLLFFALPVGLMGSLPGNTGATAGAAAFGAVAIVFVAFWAWARYVWKPRNRALYERLGLQYDR